MPEQGTNVRDVVSFMNDVAPLTLAESWDNVGLLLGDLAARANSVMTVLTLTPPTVQEAIDRSASLVVAHHPLPFKPVGSITTEDYTGDLLWRLASHGISVYCPHTAWDSSAAGINAQLAERLSLANIRPMDPSDSPGLEDCGSGRLGELTQSAALGHFASQMSELIPYARTRIVDASRAVNRVGIACGSGGGLLDLAVKSGCDTLLTGEATFHTCLQAQAAGVNLVMVGHYASERFSLETLAVQLAARFPAIEAWASEFETDPVRNL